MCKDILNREARSKAIWDCVTHIYQEKSVRIGIDGKSRLGVLIDRLKFDGVRKPWFIDPQKWIYRRILTNEYDWYALSDYIILHTVVDGDMAHWNGKGEILNKNFQIEEKSNSKLEQFAGTRSIYPRIMINLYSYENRFKGILPGIQ